MKDFIVKYWWKAVTGIVVFAMAWSAMKSEVQSNTKRLDIVEIETKEHHDFIVAQIGFNKRMESDMTEMKSDIKTILRESRRR